MNDVIASFAVALGFEVNQGSLNSSKKSIADYEKAVRDAEKRIEDARWAGATTAEEIAKLTRETNLKEARAALSAAQDRERAEKEQERRRKERHKEFIAGMNRVALAASAMATAIGYAVNKVTQSFDHLGFVSARTGASVQGLNSLGYAFKQIGGNSQQALAAVESFAKAIRENSGVKSYVQSLGVDMTKDTTDQMLDTVRALSKHPYDVGLREAGLAGISEENYKLLTQYIEQLDRYRAEYDSLTKSLGVNSKDATDASMSFQRTLTRLQATASALSDKLMVSLAPALEGIAKRFQDWITANPEKVEQILRNVSDAIVWVADKIRAMVEWFASDNGARFMERWDSFNERVKAIGTAFETVWAILKKIDSWLHLSTIYGFIDKLGTLILSGRFGLGGAIQDALGVGSGAGGTGGARQRDDRTWYEKILPKGMGGRDAPEVDGGDGMTARARRGMNRLAKNANVKAIVGELRQAGYGENAIAAVVGSMETESSFNPRAANSQNGGHTGLWQWDSTRWPKIKRWIESQGGDPYDAAWQTKAWVAEHNAKPGDRIYDNRNTERGGAILRNNPSLPDAIHGVQLSERFGRGEEGGRARHAREWLPHVSPGGSLSNTPDPQKVEIKAPNVTVKGADGSSAAPKTKLPGLPRMDPGGFDVNAIMQPAPSPALSTINNNQSSRAVHQTFHNTTTITGADKPRDAARIMESSFDNMHALALRNAQSATV